MSDDLDPDGLDAEEAVPEGYDAVGSDDSPPGVEAPSGAAAIFGPFFNAILAPSQCWEALDAKPKLAAWIAVWIAALVTVTEVVKLPATLPASVSIGRYQIEAAGGEVTAQSLRTIELFATISAYAFTPVMMLVVIALTAAVIWVFASLMGGTGVTFGRSFALASAGAVVKPFLNNVYIAVVLRLSPPEIRRPQDMTLLQPSLGLDLFLPTSDTPVWLIAVLKRVDLFSIWWIVLVSAGAIPLLKLSKGQGRAMTLIIWSLGTVVATAFALLFAS
jgi:hypothetical protein